MVQTQLSLKKQKPSNQIPPPSRLDTSQGKERSVVFMKRRVHSLSQESMLLNEPSVIYDASKQSYKKSTVFKKIQNQHKLQLKQLSSLHDQNSSSLIVKNSSPAFQNPKTNFNKTQQQFMSLQPIQFGLVEDVTSKYLNQSLYKMGETISNDANCESFEQIQLNKAIDKLLNKEIQVKDFLLAKNMHDTFKVNRSIVTPENVQNSFISPLTSNRGEKIERKNLPPEEQSYRFSQFIQLCKSQLGQRPVDSQKSEQNESNVEINKYQKFSTSLYLVEEFERDQYHINNVVQEVAVIQQRINQKIDNEGVKDSVKDKFNKIDQQKEEYSQRIKKMRNQRQKLLNQFKFQKVSKKDLVEQFKSENLNSIQIGLEEVLIQVSQWSKERADLISKLWHGYRQHLLQSLSNYLNAQKDLNLDLIQTLNQTLQQIEDQSLNLLSQSNSYQKLNYHHSELKEVFQKCADLYHREEDSNKELRIKIFNLERQIELWLPNIDKYQQSPDILIKLKSNYGSNKGWGLQSEQFQDQQLKDQMLEKLNNHQIWVKADVERLIQSSQTITNDKIECERLSRELVKVNSQLNQKRLKCKELKLDLDKTKRNMETLLHEVEQEKIKNLEFLMIRHQLQKIKNKEMKDSQIQCDFGATDPSQRVKQLMMNEEGNKSKLKKNLTEAKLNSMQAGSSSNSPRNKNIIPLDQIMNKVVQKHGPPTQELKLIDHHKRHSSSFHQKSPRINQSIISQEFKMNQIEELNQEPIPMLFQEKSQQILQVISSMMSKLVVQPYRHMKDLFLEELLNINPHPQKAGEIAEDFMKVILEIHSKDSRIKLLKAFLGLGEQLSYTQPVSQNFVNLLQDTNLAFDDIFTGEVQTLKVDIESAIELILQRIETQQKCKTQRDVVEKCIQNMIRQSNVYVNGIKTNLFNQNQVNDYRLLKIIVQNERRRKQDEPFKDLLHETNFKVEMFQFIDYIKDNLNINYLMYIEDFKNFFQTYLDTTHRGYIGGFELNNLFEMIVKIECPLLIFMKESLNSIVEYDNLVNGELEKIFKHFDSIQIQDKSQPVNAKMGFPIGIFQLASKYLISSLPQSLQKQGNQGLKDVIDLLERKKSQKMIHIEEFIQIVKDFEFFENYDNLKLYNEQNLKKQQLISKGTNSHLPLLNQKQPIERKYTRNLKIINDESANEKRKKLKHNKRASISRSKYDEMIVVQKTPSKQSLERLSLEKFHLKQDDEGALILQDSSETLEQIQNQLFDDDQYQPSHRRDNMPIINISHESKSLKDLKNNERQNEIDKIINITKIRDQESKISDLINFSKDQNLSIGNDDDDEEDQESKLQSYRSQESVQQHLNVVSRQNSAKKRNIRAFKFITPNFKVQTKFSKPPLQILKSQNKNDIGSALIRGMSIKSNSRQGQMPINQRKSSPSSSTSLISPQPKGSYILQQNAEKHSLFKNTQYSGILAITGNKI